MRKRKRKRKKSFMNQMQQIYNKITNQFKYQICNSLYLAKMNPNSSRKISQGEALKKYLIFKEQLLNRMSNQDPLSILESNVFQKYEEQMFNNHANLVPLAGSVDKCSQQIQMGTMIKQYMVDGLRIGVIQKRPHSCDSHDLKSSSNRVWINKITKMEQQSKVDLMIWSNIMYNHFRNNCSNSLTQPIEKENRSNQLNILQNHNPENKSQVTNNQELTYSILSNSQTQTQMLIQKLSERMLMKPSKKNIKLILRQFFTHLQEQNEKTIGLLNKLRKENDRLHKNVQQNSMKQLQYIVQLKHMEKRIQATQEEIKKMQNKIRVKQQQIRGRQSELNQVIRQKLREIEHLQEQNIKKSSIQQLKQKMAIDSIRRTTLCTLSKQRFEIQLKKQELIMNMEYSNSLNSTCIVNMNEDTTEETRCDDE